jgi:hypothetical protein
MTNVNGNWKKRKPIQRNLSLKKIPGQGVKTHDVMKGISFKDKAYKWGASTRAGAQKVYGNIAKNYKTYAGPTTKMFQKTGAAALGTGKFLVKRGLFGFPGLAAGAAYYGGKALVKKGERVARRSATKQWQKRDRFGRTRWYL